MTLSPHQQNRDPAVARVGGVVADQRLAVGDGFDFAEPGLANAVGHQGLASGFCARLRATSCWPPRRRSTAAHRCGRVRRFLPMVRRHVPLSRGGTERRRHLRQTETMLRGELGCDPLAAELAAALSWVADIL